MRLREPPDLLQLLGVVKAVLLKPFSQPSSIPTPQLELFFILIVLSKKDGSTIEGFRSKITPDKITLTFMGGASIDVPVKEIKDAGYIEGKSVMLETIAAGMNETELRDLVTYLRSIK